MPAERTCELRSCVRLRRRRRNRDPSSLAKRVRLVGALPREIAVITAARASLAMPAERTCELLSCVRLRRRRRNRDPSSLAKRVRLVGALPREIAVITAEVTVRGRLREDRPLQVEVTQD